MSKSSQTVMVLAICMAFIALIAGCAEKNLSNTKKHKLIAVENMQLKKQLEQRDKEIEKQKKLLDKCLRGKKALQEKPQEEGESLTKFLFEENLRLDKENKSLKAQVQQLEARVQQLVKEL